MEKNDQSQKSNRMWDSNSTCNVGSQDRLSAFSVENMDRSKYQIKNNPPLDAKSSLQVTSLFRSPLLANRYVYSLDAKVSVSFTFSHTDKIITFMCNKYR